MIPFSRKIMTVYDATLEDLVVVVKRLIAKFNEVNNFDCPELTVDWTRQVQEDRGFFEILPRQKSADVVVYPFMAARPSTGRPHQWSFPGYAVDATVFGVACHEVGHAYDFSWMGRPGEFQLRVNSKMQFNRMKASNTPEWTRILESRRRPITSAEFDTAEAMAETMRLFILNPGMLKEGWPERWEYLTRRMGLKPIPSLNKDPLAVLEAWGASEKIIAAARRRINR